VRGRLSAAITAVLVMGAPAAVYGQPATVNSMETGTLVRYDAFASGHVAPRNITVWLPPGYEQDTAHYAVLYMHDGQNLFEPETAYAGREWGIDEAMSALIAEGTVRKTIVVGVWNTPKRFLEYFPQQAFERLPEPLREVFAGAAGGTPVSDAYLRFMVEELKPFIDATYRTRPGREDTFVMGSSMGGLVSTYALIRHPDVFGGAGAVSTHWPMANPETETAAVLFGAMLATIEEGLKPGNGRIYFDFGTVNLDAWYEPLQVQVDAVMTRNGFTRGRDWVTEKFEGADHNEVSWRARVHVPLTFLLAPRY
jgi:enterochelin esterase-like enzyme